MAEICIAIATEIGISIAARTAKSSVILVLRHGKYLFRGGKIRREVEPTKQELMSKLENVQKRVEEVGRRGEKVDNAVEEWLNNVKTVMKEVQEIEEETMEEGASFCPGWFPTLRKYRICKKLSKKRNRMAELTRSSEFNPFSLRVPIQDVEYFSSIDFIYFNSTKLASQELREALKDDSTYIIGLHGMGGCGKTTLVKEVGKDAKRLNLFDRAVYITVSQFLNVMKIQGEIADMLGLSFETESETGRAQELSQRLKGGERILIILDDVWSKLNLEKIGIPMDNYDNCCKVLLTTRRSRVCNDMSCQRKIVLDILSEDEAWLLFKKKANLVDDPSNSLLNSVQQDVARECKGLPIAIVAVATSLKEKPLHVWQVALYDLRATIPIDVDEDLKFVYSCLRLSYDYLEREQAKSLFLICSMFPEDHDISIEELFRYGMGLGIYKEVDSFEIARGKVDVAINDLVNSSLLIHSENYNGEKCLKMHDMFRDMALWIAFKKNDTIMVNPSKDMNALSNDGSMKDCYALSLWCNDIYSFPQQLDAPKLGFILINSSYKLDLSYASFEGIKELKVMVVIDHINFRGLFVPPQTIQWLNNLQTLRLIRKEIDDISFVLSLRRLKILDLQSSKLKELPFGIENMDGLKLLDLSSCSIQKQENCFEVIRRCSQLEELYLLGIALPYEIFLNDVPLLKFKRYQLEIGQAFFPHRRRFANSKVLILKKMNISSLGASIKVLLQRANFVQLEVFMEGSKSIIPEMVQTVGGMKDLTTLSLRNTSTVEYIIDSTSFYYDNNSFQADAELPNLVHLELHQVNSLKEVCHGPSLPSILQNLESLDIRECHQLHSIFSGSWNLSHLKSLTISTCHKLMALFSMSVARSLSQLEDLNVVSCWELKHIIMEERQNEIDEVEEEIFPNLKIFSVKNCHKLEFVFPGECNLCNLKSLRIFTCHKLTALFSMSVARSLSQLEDLEVDSCWELKHIIMEERKNEIDEVEEEIFPNLKIFSVKNCYKLEYIFPMECNNLCNLKSLTIIECEKLMVLFSMSLAESLLLLEDLMIYSCNELKHIIGGENRNGSNADAKEIFTKLKNINVDGCDKLEYIFPRECNLCNLKSLKIGYCILLTSVFSMPVAQTLLMLEDVTVKNCEGLQFLFGEQNIGYGSSHQHGIEIVLPVLKSFTLRNLPKLVNICPENVRFRWPSLTELSCTDCTKLSAMCEYSTVGSELRSLRSNMGSDAAIANASQSSNQVSAQCKKLEILKLTNLFELSFIWMDSPQILNLRYLKELEVKGCGRLKSIFSTAISKSLLELTTIVISYCGELEEIMAENEEAQSLSNTHELGFPKLMSLEVVQCNKLKCLFSTSTSIKLPKLECLTILKAAKLEHAFRYRSNKVGTDSMEKIILPKLRTVQLKQLQHFVDISQGLNLHVLEPYSMVVHDCPKFAPNFAHDASLHTCCTQVLTTTDGQVSKEGSYFGLASTIEDKQKKIISSTVQRLELKNLSELMIIWKGPTLMSFQNLVSLKVVGCSKLKSIFSGAIITSLPQLQELNIEECNEVEEIVSSNAQGGKCHCDFSPKSCPQQVCFPKMTRVEIRSCNKMKFLFPLYIAEHLQRLEFVEIAEASQLEFVFSCGREFHDHSGDQVATMLPGLKDLLISRVPRFDCVVCGGLQYQLYFPSLEEKYRHHLRPSSKAHNPGDGHDGHSMKMNSDFSIGDGHDGHPMKMNSNFSMGDGHDGHSMKMNSDFMGDGHDGHSMKMNSDFSMGDGHDGHPMKMNSNFSMGDGHDGHSMNMESYFMSNGYDDYSMMMDSDFIGDGYLNDSDFKEALELIGDDFDDDSLE